MYILGMCTDRAKEMYLYISSIPVLDWPIPGLLQRIPVPEYGTSTVFSSSLCGTIDAKWLGSVCAREGRGKLFVDGGQLWLVYRQCAGDFDQSFFFTFG